MNREDILCLLLLLIFLASGESKIVHELMNFFLRKLCPQDVYVYAIAGDFKAQLLLVSTGISNQN